MVAAVQLVGTLLDNGSVIIQGEVENFTLTSAQYQNVMINLLGWKYRGNMEASVAVFVLYVLVFILAVVSNTLVIVVIYKFQHLRRSFRLFYCHLSIGGTERNIGPGG